MRRCGPARERDLGGRLVGPEGNPFSPDLFGRGILEIDRGLREADFPPGGDSTLLL